jgi:arylsulfate sulfotransferase
MGWEENEDPLRGPRQRATVQIDQEKRATSKGARCFGIAALVACLWIGCTSATEPTFAVASSTPGPTPFISFVELSAESLGGLQSIGYVIQPKPGSVSKPVSVTLTLERLRSRGYVSRSTITLPVFGLYAGFTNTVNIQLQFDSQSSQSLPVELTTAPYTDPLGIYDQPTILIGRAPGSSLGFDFFALKSLIEPVVIVDTDGTIRWVGSGEPASGIVFVNGGFVVGSHSSAQFSRLDLDGTITTSAILDPNVVDTHHNIDPGKLGVLIELDTTTSIEATVEDVGPSGVVFRTWDLAALLAAYMNSQGDDAGAFVRPGVDWFHNNAATYDPRDDSLIVSSRENFVIKIDYATGAPIWILGDPTKYWHSFPSLRAKALTLVGGGLYPIGQHATSITSDGFLMVFNDGLGSLNQPSGEPAGESRSYSAVSAYSIDLPTMTAQEVWDVGHNQDILSIICSSAYEASGKSLLVDYACADGGATARLLGLDAAHDVIFDFAYQSTGLCKAAWNAVPLPLDNLQLQ